MIVVFEKLFEKLRYKFNTLSFYNYLISVVSMKMKNNIELV
jgi:hypothetical protein